MSDAPESPIPPDQQRKSRSGSRSTGARSHRPRTRRTSAARSADRGVAGLVAFTVDAGTARVLGVQAVDAHGRRHDLTSTERETLLKQARGGRLEDLLERAFEAGIACVLDSDAGSDARQESAAEAELRHRLLEPLIERSPVRELTDSAVLDRAILCTLIDHSTKRSLGED